MRLNLTMLKLK